MVMVRQKSISIVVFVMVAIAASIGSVSLGDKPDKTSVSEAVPDESKETILYLRSNGTNMEGRVAIRFDDDAVERCYVPKDGYHYKVRKGSVTLHYINPITVAATQLWRGEKHIGDIKQLETKTIIDLNPVDGRIITIKAVDQEGAPLAKTRVEVCEEWEDSLVASLGQLTDENGTIKVYLADDSLYKVRKRWLASPIPVQSPSFVPKKLKSQEFTFSPPSPEETGFTIKFAITEDATQGAPKNIRSIEIVHSNKSLMAGVYEGRAILIVGDEEESFKVGEKISLHLPIGAAKRYRIAKPIIEVGKAGTSVDVELLPIKDALLEWEVTTDGKMGVVPVVAAIHIKASENDGWTRTNSDRAWKCQQGLYDITAFAYGYRVYRGVIKANASKQTVPIELETADKAEVTIALNGTVQKDVHVRVVYPDSDTGPLTNRLVLTNGKGNIFYDGKETAGLFVYAEGCAPALVTLDKSKLVYNIPLEQVKPIKVTVERNQAVKGIDAKHLMAVKIVSIKPWRQVISMVKNGAVTLKPGKYIPIIDLAVNDPSVSMVGKVVECEPVIVTEDTRNLIAKPLRIVPMTDVTSKDPRK
jgi:hypothetical protein